MIFTSDNGPEYFAYERILQHHHYSMGAMRGVKKDTWEGGHRVPFLAHWPGVVPAGARCDQLVSLVDFMATCADLTGTPLPSGASEDGVSILSLLRGDLDKPARDYAVHHGYSGGFAIRYGEWVYLEAPGGQDPVNDEPAWFREERGYPALDGRAQLFQLNGDPAQSQNRIGDEPAMAAKLASLLESVRQGQARITAANPDEIISE